MPCRRRDPLHNFALLAIRRENYHSQSRPTRTFDPGTTRGSGPGAFTPESVKWNQKPVRWELNVRMGVLYHVRRESFYQSLLGLPSQRFLHLFCWLWSFSAARHTEGLGPRNFARRPLGILHAGKGRGVFHGTSGSQLFFFRLLERSHRTSG